MIPIAAPPCFPSPLVLIMTLWQSHRCCPILPALFGILLAASSATAQAGPDEEYFETNIRPLLAKRCFDCHGEKKQESDVRMDRKAAVMGTGSNAPLVLPGKVDGSRLWQVIQHAADDVQMPPKEKMPAEELAVIRTWIERGAYWPEETHQTLAHIGQPRHPDGSYNFTEAVKQHWAYQKVANVPVPEPVDQSSCRTPIDRFLAIQLEEKKLQFSPLAAREKLIRRIAVDLTGVPPTFAEVQAFVADQSPDAIERIIDRYLASPQYGERWGRHWLDVARYADTKGYVFTDNRFYPYSYTYRDYVVKALNDDVPYNQFVLEQLAADRLGYDENDPRLAALGFLTVGNRFLNRVPDIIDDRIDVVTRGLMGMTVACARCHDHKYDPIPTADYYALYGVFNSSFEPEMGPIVGTVDEANPEYQKFVEELKKREKELSDFIDSNHQNLTAQLTDRSADCLLGASHLLNLIPKEGIPYADKEPRIKLQERWKACIEQQLKQKEVSPVWIPWKTLMSIPDAELAANSEAKLKPILENDKIPPQLRECLKAAAPKSHLQVAQAYGSCFSQIVAEWKKGLEQSPPLEALADANQEQLRKSLFGPGSVTDIPGGEASPLFERDQRDRIRVLKAKINDWYAQSAGAPARAMVMFDKEKPANSPIFQRGDPNRRGDVVTRHAPRILQPEAEQPFKEGSGRLELAKVIIAESNPLTARVIVNRVWAHHFGAGLVDSSSDFGSRASQPTHPELLDYLAWTFVHDDKWSLKSLHRRIMLSHAYLQESVEIPSASKVDPQNILLWRQNRQRLDFEGMRDSMLAVSGQLNDVIGGRPMQLDSDQLKQRRTLYALIDRNNLPGLFRTFDYPSPDASSPGRPLTTVPQQALYFMNSPFVQSVSETLAEQIRQQSSEPSGQSELLVQRVFSRRASQEEVTLLANYLEKHPLEQLAQALLMTNEFMFID